jgi:hypothetical protein
MNQWGFNRQLLRAIEGLMVGAKVSYDDEIIELGKGAK